LVHSISFETNGVGHFPKLPLRWRPIFSLEYIPQFRQTPSDLDVKAQNPQLAYHVGLRYFLLRPKPLRATLLLLNAFRKITRFAEDELVHYREIDPGPAVRRLLVVRLCRGPVFGSGDVIASNAGRRAMKTDLSLISRWAVAPTHTWEQALQRVTRVGPCRRAAGVLTVHEPKSASDTLLSTKFSQSYFILSESARMCVFEAKSGIPFCASQGDRLTSPLVVYSHLNSLFRVCSACHAGAEETAVPLQDLELATSNLQSRPVVQLGQGEAYISRGRSTPVENPPCPVLCLDGSLKDDSHEKTIVMAFQTGETSPSFLDRRQAR
jgi:hypothetical protein